MADGDVEMGGRRPEARSQKSEVRSQKSEVRSQKSEVPHPLLLSPHFHLRHDGARPLGEFAFEIIFDATVVVVRIGR